MEPRKIRHPSCAFHTRPLYNPQKRQGSRRSQISCTAAPPKKVLILGGTGRVGTEAARALLETTNVSITVASRHPTHPLPHTTAAPADITEAETLIPLIQSHDVVLHTAGPFQFTQTPSLVLQYCLRNGTPYVDISDDTVHSKATKALHEQAIVAHIPCLISTGIYPGLSNLLATRAVTKLQTLASEVYDLHLYYHTAGSGGIGVAVLAATMLLLSEPATEHTPTGPVYHPAASGVTEIDFGSDIGKIATYRLNLPEVYSLHNYLTPTANVSARFSTAPPVWNLLLRGMARLPKGILSNPAVMQPFAKFSMPIVKAVDRISGARTGIVAKASGGGRTVVVRFACERLDRYVGLCTAAFVKALSKGSVEPGVWFPEELPERVREQIIADAVGDGKLEVFVDGTPV